MALIIGIDNYAPPKDAKISAYRSGWPSLDGCKNDAAAMKAIITSSFGFPSKNIKELFDTAASRASILNSIENLISTSKTGDIVFIYYAGHGSQVKNTLSVEQDHKDESIVPADAWKEGVADIRDKELAALCNRFIDKAVKLTLVFDCCHSGSIARALYQPKYRFIEASDLDVKDASNPVPPEKRKGSGYLILSASQDNEYAQEQRDDNNIPHGAFTLALIKALNQLQSSASVENIFTALRAILKSNGKSQEPVMAADPERKASTLFGSDWGSMKGRNLVPVERVDGNKILLEAGFAAGINVDNELISVDTKEQVKIKVTAVTGIGHSEATILEGKPESIEPGQLFEVTNWVSSDAPLLKIFIPGGKYSYEDISKLAAVKAALKKNKQLTLLNEPGEKEPDMAISIADNKYIVYDYTKGIKGSTILQEYTATAITKIAKGKKLFINLPASLDLQKAIRSRFNAYKVIQLVQDPLEAQYILYGTMDADLQPQYGLLSADISLKDSLPVMPVSTAVSGLTDNSKTSCERVANFIFESALKLSKLRGWLNLEDPKGTGFFPYHLAVRKKRLKNNHNVTEVQVGDELALYVEADNNYLDKAVQPKFIYVFIIDSKGKMDLLFPSGSEGNNENKFPVSKDGKSTSLFLLRDDIVSYEPVGTDSYFLLASAEPITNYQRIFQQDGVRGGWGDGSNDPLTRLMDMGNESSARGVKNITAANWSLKKLLIKTKK